MNTIVGGEKLKKKVTQGLIYIIEVSVFLFVIMCVYSKLEHGSFIAWRDDILTLKFLADLGVIYVGYQLLIYTFISLSDASKNDALLQIKSMIKMTIHYSSYGQSFEEIQGKLNELLYDKEGYYMLSRNDIQRLKEIETLIEKHENNELDIDSFQFWLGRLLILVEHDNEYNNLLWRNSILLRIIK